MNAIPRAGRLMRFTVAVVAALLAGRTASAVNTAFVPADAFFHSVLYDEWFKEVDGPMSFRYVMPADYEGALCGYAGFGTLEVTGDTSALRKSLRDVYDVARDSPGIDGPNDLHVFIYGRDFNVNRGVGLKFNEDWMDEIPPQKPNAFAPDGVSGVYIPFADSREAVFRDWKLSKSVGPLPIEPPESPVVWGKPVEEPVRIPADRVQMIVIPTADLEPYAVPKRGVSQAFYSITSDGAETLRFVDKRVRRSRFERGSRDWVDQEITELEYRLQELRVIRKEDIEFAEEDSNEAGEEVPE